MTDITKKINKDAFTSHYEEMRINNIYEITLINMSFQ